MTTMSYLSNASRRAFLRQAGSMAAFGAAAPTALNLAALGTAAAAAASDYKALVCVFLSGGNDPFNTVLATDAASWANYTAVRKQAPDPIALLGPGTAPVSSAKAGSPARLGGVLPIVPMNPQGRSYALHPMLAGIKPMFDARRLAVVANVGPLVMPTTKAQYATLSHPKPARLFSHNDQQAVWQAFAPEGTGGSGWGGRMGDLFAAANGGSMFTAVSAGGKSVWLSGLNTRIYQIGTAGTVRYPTDPNGSLYSSAEVGAALLRMASTAYDGHVLKTDVAAAARHSMDAEAMLRSVLKPAGDALWATPASSYSQSSDPRLKYVNPLNGSSTLNPLAAQFQAVARMIEASGALGLKRQVFFVNLSVSGFDTHNAQNGTHANLLAQLSQGLTYFDGVLGSLNARSQVTTFTASEFGRSFTSNGDGTDHGWGGHQFVLGAAVKGGDLYGNFPQLGAKNASNNEFDSSPNQLLNGALLPEVSVDQFGATLARWMGVSDAQQLDIFPNLDNFDAAKRNLGFMA